LEGRVRLVPESLLFPFQLEKTEDELNADEFAVELLVPTPLLRNYKSSGMSIAFVARKFLVTESVSSSAVIPSQKSLRK
jgi:hypothetical protein